MRPAAIRGLSRLLTILVAALALLTGQPAPNPGLRHQSAGALSAQALAFYGEDRAFSVLRSLSPQTDEGGWDSPLRAALRELMQPKTRVSYAAASRWFPYTDGSGGEAVPLLFYSDGAGAWNREQIWPASRGNFYQEGAGCDLHHLRPADPQVNQARGVMTFGDVRNQGGDVEICCAADGSPVLWSLPNWQGGRGLVEVRDGVKGDVARILLYVYVCYGGEGENQNLFLDQPPTGEGILTNDGPRVIQSLDTLLAWCALDPVDAWEQGRNDVVQTIQGNRNVFIDYPELAWLLFDQPIPDMPTPSGYAHSLTYRLTARAEPEEGGTAIVEGRTVTAQAAPGWTLAGWRLEPEKGARVEQEGETFTLLDLTGDCSLILEFALTDPCWAGHTWDSGRVTLEPGCETEGTRTYACQVCGSLLEESLPALGHALQSYTVPPSCTQAGYTRTYCLRCDLDTLEPGAPALGHDWDEGSLTREPTQTQPGEWSSQCRRCGLWRREPVAFRFSDVADPDKYYYEPVYWALSQTPPITTGVTETEFAPQSPCTRGQVVTFLWRAAGCPPPENPDPGFYDVKPGDYDCQAVAWAVEWGITNGRGDGSFGSRLACTRAQAVTFLWRAAGSPAPQGGHGGFRDVNPSAYYAPAVLWAVEQGITKGITQTEFCPNRGCTRAQVVTFLYRAAASPP